MDPYRNAQYGSQMQSGNPRRSSEHTSYGGFMGQDTFSPGQYPLQDANQTKMESAGQGFDFDSDPMSRVQSMDLGGHTGNGMQGFGGSSLSRNATMSPFEVVPSSDMSQTSMMASGPMFGQGQGQQLGPGQGLGLVPQFMNNADPFGVGSQSSPFDSPMGSSHLDIGMDGQYMPGNIPMGMNFSSAGLGGMMNGMGMDYSMMAAGQFQNPQLAALSSMQDLSRRGSMQDAGMSVSMQQQQSQSQQTPRRRSSNSGSERPNTGNSQEQHNNSRANQSRRQSVTVNGQANSTFQSQQGKSHSRRPSQAGQETINNGSQSQSQDQSQNQSQNQSKGQNQVQNHDHSSSGQNQASWSISQQQQQQQRQQQQQNQQNQQQQQQQQQQQLQQLQQQIQQSQQQQLQPHPQAQPQPNTLPMKMPLHPQHRNFINAYSSSGFDMLKVLSRVVSRKNPEINIGAVDLSCAFVVCDAQEHDSPIMYCSENFERLTGYTKHEILGRNCRFLQAPDGRVQAGIKRTYVDDDSVLYLKNKINAKAEAQVSLINYRKGGQPFMNLLTTIPIAWDDGEIKYIIGFQVDLVEQPNAVTDKNTGGTYAVNYQRGLQMPRYIFDPNKKSAVSQLESGQTVSRDDVSTVLNNIQDGSSDLSHRIWDKVLLENTDDVVFVLSLKGLFLYLSPSSTKILEYEPGELIGSALSSVCHPSDIVPVTRELKETTTGASADVVFRFRRKDHGYMWFEGHGSLHVEQGKGRKSIVLVGRERPVYALSKSEVLASGGIGDNEIWGKLSTSGVFLFVASNVKQLLDRTQEDLIGTSIQALMRADSRPDFSRILDIAKTGKRASVKHEIMNKRGQVVQAFSTLYPGDAIEGQKPTFIISQTRLIKYTRPSGSSSRPQPKFEHQSSMSSTMSGSETPSMSSFPFTASPYHSSGVGPSSSLKSPQRFMSTFESAATFSGQHGLAIGRQDVALASSENLFDELKTTRSTSWQYELRQMEKKNRLLAEELQNLLAARKKRKRRKQGALQKDCANCHTRVTPEWRRGPSGQRDLCNSCGLRWAKQQGRISPRTTKSGGSRASGGAGSNSPANTANKANNDASPKTGEVSEVRRRLSGSGIADPTPSSGSSTTRKRRDSASDVATSRNSLIGATSPSIDAQVARLEKEDSNASSNKVMKLESGSPLDDTARDDNKSTGSGAEDDEFKMEGVHAESDASDRDDEVNPDENDNPTNNKANDGSQNAASSTGDALGDMGVLGDMGIGMSNRNSMRHSGDPNTGTELDDVAENFGGEVAAEKAMS